MVFNRNDRLLKELKRTGKNSQELFKEYETSKQIVINPIGYSIAFRFDGTAPTDVLDLVKQIRKRLWGIDEL